jgi:hypothetical protein
MNDAILDNNAPAAESLVREHFPLILNGFEIFQKSIFSLVEDVTVLKSAIKSLATCDEDRVNEGDDSLVS